MTSNQLVLEIKEAATKLGYDKCGIINISTMKGYREKLAQRIERFPDIQPHSEEFFSFAELEKDYPWAKSVIICVRHYGKYHIPEHLQGIIAKYYLVDSRKDENSKDYQASIAFEDFLTAKNIRNETRRDFGITSLRWAAQAAGLGIILEVPRLFGAGRQDRAACPDGVEERALAGPVISHPDDLLPLDIAVLLAHPRLHGVRKDQVAGLDVPGVDPGDEVARIRREFPHDTRQPGDIKSHL